MGNKTDVVVKLVLVFFISLLSFSIGTFVGKKYSDNQHQLSQLEPLKNEHHERSVASTSEEGEKKSGAMSDEEIAKLAEEFVGDESKPPLHGEKAEGEAKSGEHEEHAEQAEHAEHGEHAANAEHSEHADTHSATHKANEESAPSHEQPSAAAKELAGGKTTSHEAHGSGHSEPRIPSSLPKDVAQFTVGKFTVQVASYADEYEAQKTATELKDKGYSAFYIPASIKGKTWYRVSVGQFATLKEATSYRSELLTKAKVNTAIVQKITE